MQDLTRSILEAYRTGVFPMAESADDPNFAFYRPYNRGLLSISSLHISASLLKLLRAKKFTPSMNRAFADVIDGCAAETPKRSKTWINKPIRNIFCLLHAQGHAHSIEVWKKDGTLAGGLYGLAIGSVFCGESMFSNETGASKAALVYLCALLWKQGFTVLDTQFINPHLLQFGAYEIPQEEYEALIQTEMESTVKIPDMTPDAMNGALRDYLIHRSL